MPKREPRSREVDDVEANDTEQSASKRPPFPKRKVAILMGYCGTNYQGMQLYNTTPFTPLINYQCVSNPNAKTIELELWNALVADGLVSKENAVDPKKVC